MMAAQDQFLHGTLISRSALRLASSVLENLTTCSADLREPPSADGNASKGHDLVIRGLDCVAFSATLVELVRGLVRLNNNTTYSYARIPCVLLRKAWEFCHSATSYKHLKLKSTRRGCCRTDELPKRPPLELARMETCTLTFNISNRFAGRQS